MAKGYTTVAEIELALGAALTPEQTAWCELLLTEVEAVIDHETARAWLEPSPTTEVIPVHGGGYFTLVKAPMVAVTGILARATPLDTAPVLLGVTDYALAMPDTGLVWVPGYRGWQLDVTYTHDGPPCPGDISLATQQIVSQAMSRQLSDVSDPNISEYRVGAELAVVYGDLADSRGWPAAARRIVDLRRRLVVA